MQSTINPEVLGPLMVALVILWIAWMPVLFLERRSAEEHREVREAALRREAQYAALAQAATAGAPSDASSSLTRATSG